MATFAYSGRTRGGQTVTGEHVADSMDAAVAALRRDRRRIAGEARKPVVAGPLEEIDQTAAGMDLRAELADERRQSVRVVVMVMGDEHVLDRGQFPGCAQLAQFGIPLVLGSPAAGCAHLNTCA